MRGGFRCFYVKIGFHQFNNLFLKTETSLKAGRTWELHLSFRAINDLHVCMWIHIKAHLKFSFSLIYNKAKDLKITFR